MTNGPNYKDEVIKRLKDKEIEKTRKLLESASSSLFALRYLSQKIEDEIKLQNGTNNKTGS